MKRIILTLIELVIFGHISFAQMINRPNYSIDSIPREYSVEKYSISYNTRSSDCDTVWYSVMEVKNNSNYNYFILFDNQYHDNSFNVYDLLYDRFLLIGDISLIQAITESNILSSFDLNETFIKRIKPGEKFTLISDCDDNMIDSLYMRICIVSGLKVDNIDKLRILNDLDSWIFDIPDLLYVPKSLIDSTNLINDNNININTAQSYSDIIEKVKKFIYEYSLCYIDNTGLNNWLEFIDKFGYSKNFSNNIKRLYTNLHIQKDPIFRNNDPMANNCISFELSVDEKDYQQNYTTIKLKISYKDCNNNTIDRFIRVLKNRHDVVISHIYDLQN